MYVCMHAWINTRTQTKRFCCVSLASAVLLSASLRPPYTSQINILTYYTHKEGAFLPFSFASLCILRTGAVCIPLTFCTYIHIYTCLYTCLPFSSWTCWVTPQPNRENKLAHYDHFKFFIGIMGRGSPKSKTK